MRCMIEAKKAVAAGANLEDAATLTIGRIDVNLAWLLTGNGSGDLSAPLQYRQQFTDATGVQALDLGSLTGPFGEAVDFAGVRLVAIHNQATDAAHVLTVAPSAANGFPGDLATDGGTEDPILTIQPGAVGIYACKPLGTPHDVSTDGKIDLDFGANSFDAEVIVLGNA